MSEKRSFKILTPFYRIVRFLRSCGGRKGLYELQVKNDVIHTPKVYRRFHGDPFWRALDEEGLLITGKNAEGQDSFTPILNICFGFANYEFVSAPSKKTYPLTSAWISWIKLRGRNDEQSPCWEKYCEPCFDHLPGSMWLETINTSYPILISLNKLKNRRKNISQIRALSGEHTMDTFTTSGDFHANDQENGHVGPNPLHALELLAVFAIRVSELGERQRRFARNRNFRIADETLLAKKSQPSKRRSRMTLKSRGYSETSIPVD